MTKRLATTLGLTLALSLATPITAMAAPGTTLPAGSTSITATDADPLAALAANPQLSPELRAQIRALSANLPADWQARRLAAADKLGIEKTEWLGISESVIDLTGYQCSATPMQEWLNQQTADIDPGTMFALQFLGILDLPTYDALLYGKESKSNTFGYDGKDTNQLNRSMKNLRKFWDIDGSAIQLIPMHGDVLLNKARLVELYKVLYGLDDANAEQMADIANKIALGLPALDKGNSPILTFNAFAYDPTGDAEAEALGITKRIVIGDGVLAGLDGAGLTEDAAAQAVLAHEYAHQVQYAKHLMESPVPLSGAVEETRRTELMADAFGTYAMVHSKGLAVNAKRTLQVEKSFFNVGDCQYDSSGHHGTPNQRFRAASWAVDIVNSAPNQGHQLRAVPLDNLFEKKLPDFVAPDA